MLAAILKKIPTLAFEPNLVPGFANRLVARRVSAAAVHFADTARFFRHAEVTGVPVRQAFFDMAGPVPRGNPTLLIFGGSQGAHAINKVVMDSVPALRDRLPQIHIVHQTGERDYNDAAEAYAGLGDSIEVFKFIDDMPGFFARADLLVCRSGASTVAEVAAAGKPAIFIPFPRAADNHQKRNAEALERAGAAVMLEESKLDRDSLVETVSSLLSDRPRLERMGQAAKKLSHPSAASDIASMAARLAGAKN
jgi:UDP-N-acetylglucosamine--N-acetylmuramyl-(pentapeptide) pyrophosphoryl-undecaprenol N-acetylglucosamine transferase